MDGWQERLEQFDRDYWEWLRKQDERSEQDEDAAYERYERDRKE